ncbi:MAG: AMP-binding protein, partial [Pseudomonadota bacterium]
YIFETFDVKAVVYDSEFAEQVAYLKDAAPLLSYFFEVTDGALANGFAKDFDQAIATPAPSPVTPYDGEDAMMFIATGGTTGMPKAVMWRQRDLWVNTFYGVWPSDGDIPVEVAMTLERYAELAAEQPEHSMRTRGPNMVLSPLMHGAGLLTATVTLLKGGAIITSASRKFDASVVLDEIAANKAIAVTLVGDAFAGPLADEIEARPSGREDFASVRTVMSSGVAFNSAHKEVMIQNNPNLAIIDALGSSEAGATGAQVSTAAGVQKAPSFKPFNMDEIKVFDEDMAELPPGSEEFGMLARSGAIPLGPACDGL